MRQIKLIIAALLLISPFAANAELINATSLQGDTVLDTVNNQEWLDLSVTRALSPDDALSLYSGARWHWATNTEVSEMLVQFFNGAGPNIPTFRPSPIGSVVSGMSNSQFLAYQTLFGNTRSGFQFVGGWYDDLVPDNRQEGMYWNDTQGGAGGPTFSPNSDSADANANYGTFLVRATSAPDSDGDGVADDDDFCPDTAIPESVPTVSLKPNHWALIDGDSVFDTASKGKGEGPDKGYTIKKTAGCSCEQIIDAQGLGKGNTKNGCSIDAMDNWVELVIPVPSSTMRIEETDITLVGSWGSEGGFPEYSGGTAVYANFHVYDPDAYAYFEFVGSGITWIGARSGAAGLFEWVIDEGTADEIGGTVNTYIDGIDRSTTELLATNLSSGWHTFTFRSLGIRGLTMEPGDYSETYIDAFDVTP
jgi:hypothetical protein